MGSDSVNLRLPADEALVLFDLLHRWEDSGAVAAPSHEAEQVVLWNLSAALESLMHAPFAANYRDLVEGARQRIITEAGS